MPRKDLHDLTGKRFGTWTVLKRGSLRTYPSGGQHWTWLCRCDCGAEMEVLGVSLRSGRTHSCWACGRARALKTRRARAIKMHVGQQVGKNRVLSLVQFGAMGEPAIWKLRCVCGKEFESAVRLLRTKQRAWPVDCGCGAAHKVPHFTVDGKTQSLVMWAKELGITRQALHSCYHRGHDMEQAIRKRMGRMERKR